MSGREIPMMGKNEVEMIKKYLRSTMVMLEWGIGGSTVVFPPLVSEYYCIEHSEKWFNIYQPLVHKKVQLKYVRQGQKWIQTIKKDPEGKHLRGRHKNAARTTRENFVNISIRSVVKYLAFKDYVDYIHKIANGRKGLFDAILIDGRARAFCAIVALPYVRRDSVVFFHDFNDKFRKDVLQFYNIVNEVGSLAVLQKKLPNGKEMADLWVEKNSVRMKK